MTNKSPLDHIEETLGAAQNGLDWYANEHPEDYSGADDEMREQINLALAHIQELRESVEEIEKRFENIFSPVAAPYAFTKALHEFVGGGE